MKKHLTAIALATLVATPTQASENQALRCLIYLACDKKLPAGSFNNDELVVMAKREVMCSNFAESIRNSNAVVAPGFGELVVKYGKWMLSPDPEVQEGVARERKRCMGYAGFTVLD